MGRNLDNPFIPSDKGSLFGLGFFSNSFISIPFRVSPRALRQAEPIGGTSPHTRRQYRGPFCGVSRELPLNHRSHPSNSFEFSRSLTGPLPYRSHSVKRLAERGSSTLIHQGSAPPLDSISKFDARRCVNADAWDDAEMGREGAMRCRDP